MASSGFKNTPDPYCVNACERGKVRGRKGKRERERFKKPLQSVGGKTQMSLHIIQGSGHRFAALNSSFQGSFSLFSPLVYLLGSDFCGWENLGILAYFALLLEPGLLFFLSFLSLLPLPPNLPNLSALLLPHSPDHTAFFHAPFCISVSPSLILVRALAGSQISWTQDKLPWWWAWGTIFLMFLPSKTEDSRGGRVKKEKSGNTSKCLSTIHWYSHSESQGHWDVGGPLAWPFCFTEKETEDHRIERLTQVLTAGKHLSSPHLLAPGSGLLCHS